MAWTPVADITGPAGPAGDPWPAPIVLIDAAEIITDAAAGSHFRVSITGNRTLLAPGNPSDGQRCVWAITASGADRTLSLATGTGGFAFGTDLTALTLIKAGTTDYLGAIFHAGASRWHVLAYSKGF